MGRSAGHKGVWGWNRGALIVALSILLGAPLGCRQAELTLPDADALEEAYTYHGDLKASMNGNVAEITIVQPDRQLLRGGTLWAKVGPYILLFSSETEDLFREYSGLAGVRTITVTPGGSEVARALLTRTTLNDITWRKALYIAGMARRDGTRKPTLLEDLVQWGEDHTEFSYNPSYSRP